MKLHRIQACNLNSLYGEQGVDLDRDLGGATLFLVLGPTGSGKSTLMDAVGLALFGTTPRLEGLRGEAVAEQVMSRGAGTARAVVEFSKLEAGSRVRFRASWKARRARGRSDGAMQAIERSLERLLSDGTAELLASGSRVRDVQEKFDEVLERFTAQDFQRSMLLAQGRFDAMLRAAPEERASILERLTATRLYKDIGQFVAGIAARWRDRQRDVDGEVSAIPEQDPVALAAARDLAAEGTQALDALDATIRQREGWRAWLAQAARLQGERREAAEHRARLAGEEAAAEPALRALADHERCADGFALHDAVREAVTRTEQAKREHAEVLAGIPGLDAARAQAEARAAHAVAAAEAAEGALAALRGPVQAVREARRALVEAQREAAEAATRLAELNARSGVEEAEQAGRERALADAARAQAEAEAANAALAGDTPLVDALPDLVRRADRLAQTWSRIEEQREATAALATSIAARGAALAAQREAVATEAQARLAPLRAEAGARAEALGGLVGEADPDLALADLRARAEAAHRRAQRIAIAVAAIRGRDRAAEEHARREVRRAEAQGRQEAAEAAVIRAEAGVEHCAAALDQARCVRAPLERIAALGDQRAALVAGEPCPLCGSPDHPFVSDAALRGQASAAAAELSVAERAVRDAEAALAQARRADGGAREEAAVARAAKQAAERELAEAGATLERAAQEAREALAAAALAPETSAAAADAAQAGARDEGEVLQGRASGVERAVRDLRLARDAVAQAEHSLAERSAALDGETAALEEARAGHDRQAAAHRTAEVELERERDALAASLAPFGIAAIPAEAGLREAQRRAGAVVAARDGLRAAAARQQIAVREQALGVAAREKALAQAREAEVAHRAREAARDRARAEAGNSEAALAAAWQAAVALGLPDPTARPGPGADPEALLASQQAQLATARQRAEEARRAAGKAAADHGRAEAGAEELARQAQARLGEQAGREAGLAARLAALGVPDRGALEERRLGTARLAELRARRSTLDVERAKADARIEAALRQVERHLGERPPELAVDASEEGIAAWLAAAAADRADRARALDEVRADLQVAERDAALRAAAEARQAAVRDRARVWLDLHELIGKADGKHFQIFAQALNLDRLLARANLHLARLSERYRLCTERDPETGMPALEFAVEDAWQPGATRSLRTLSGGESFLVSLALALGLSDLRTSSMPVETLMLDEGFGTLDPRTLEIALAALQQLQAAGRQIGIVSHVEALRENIPARIVVEPVGEGRSRVRALVGAR